MEKSILAGHVHNPKYICVTSTTVRLVLYLPFFSKMGVFETNRRGGGGSVEHFVVLHVLLVVSELIISCFSLRGS